MLHSANGQMLPLTCRRLSCLLEWRGSRNPQSSSLKERRTNELRFLGALAVYLKLLAQKTNYSGAPCLFLCEMGGMQTRLDYCGRKKRYCALSFSGTSPFCSHIQRHLSYFFKYWHLKNRNKTRERNGIKHGFLLRHKNHDAGILGPVLSINGPEYYYLLIANYSFCFQSSARLINSEVS